MLEGVHTAGYTFNDLKLDNIMVGFQSKLPKEYSEENVFTDATLHLVDFGFATRFVNKHTGAHIAEEEVETFRGNMIFGSLNQLNFKVTSRRDDLISLSYMLIYMLNKGELTGIDLESNLSNTEAFKLARKAKENHTMADLCCKEAQIMVKFVAECFSLKFEETPDYNKLRKIITETFSNKNDLDTSSSSIEGEENLMDEDNSNWSESNQMEITSPKNTKDII